MNPNIESEYDTDGTQLDDNTFEEIVNSKTVTMPDGEDELLSDLMEDITEAHRELNQYKNGALAMCGALDDAILEARSEDDENTAEALETVKQAGFGIYLRLKVGDEELFEGDGDYEDFLDKM